VKLAAFYSDSPYASWGQSRGFGRALRRMGHDVVEIAVPPVKSIGKAKADAINKPIEDCDAAIVSGPEHLERWIKTFYPRWDSYTFPKIAWYHESFIREDYSLDFSDYERRYTHHFFPDARDAEKFKGEHLSLGIDTEIFHDLRTQPRDVEVAFIGLLYEKRARFLEEVKPHLGDIKVRVASGNVLVQDLDGINVEKSTELLADQYRRIQVFVTFPSLSNVLVAKVLETMACGCTLVAPTQPVHLEKYYAYETPAECAKQIKRALTNPIGACAAKEAKKHSIESRFETLLEKAGLQCVTA